MELTYDERENDETENKPAKKTAQPFQCYFLGLCSCGSCRSGAFY